MKEIKLWHRLVLIFTGLFLFACSEKGVQQTDKSLLRPAKVAFVKSAIGNNMKVFPATVEPTYDAQLAFRVNGEIAERLVVAGQTVKEGDVLARLDDKDFLLQLKQAQARYNLSKSQYQRSKQLFEEKLIAVSFYDEAQAQLDIAEAQLDAAKTNLKYTILKAPFDGVIAQLHVEPYEFVQAKQPIMELQGRDLVDVTIQVPETLMARVSRSAETNLYQPTLILDAKPDTKFKVFSREHDITPNPMTKSYQVVFAFKPPEDINVLAGMTGSLYVELDRVLGVQSSSLIVPIESVFLPNEFAGQDKHFLYRLDSENKVQLIEVQLVKVNQEGALIQPVNNNLKVDDVVIAAGSHLLQNGQQVKPWFRERGL